MGSFIVTAGPNKGQLFRLTGAECIVGRDPECAFQLTDNLVSRRHFRIAFDESAADSGVTITDLGSVNGTLVKGAKVSGSVKLNDGDDVVIGNTTLHFAARKLAGPAFEQQIHRQSEKYTATTNLNRNDLPKE